MTTTTTTTTIKSNFNRSHGDKARALEITNAGGNNVHLYVQRDDHGLGAGIRVPLTELLDVLAENFPDYGIKYEDPIPFPTKLGTMLVTYKDVDGEPTQVIRFFNTLRGWTNDSDLTPWFRTDRQVADWLNSNGRGFNVVPVQD